jgi:thiaminase/transcriptional activator TenA
VGALSERLWNAHRDTVRACREHPFVRALGDGTLPEAVFRRYVAQDAFYLRGFFRAYALAAARLERPAHLEAFHEFMGGALEEMRMHARTAERLGIDLDAVVPFEATRSYVGHLSDLGWHGTAGEILAAMAPCMRLYAHLGVELSAGLEAGTAHPYREWIEAYSGGEFVDLCDRLESLLGELAADTIRVREAYAFSMRCELAFFEAAWKGE